LDRKRSNCCEMVALPLAVDYLYLLAKIKFMYNLLMLA
jgi:hypothetical protein